MESLHVKAYAKLNLTLDVLRKRPDGYHDMKMVMQTVELCDHLSLTFGGSGLRVRSNLRFLPTDGKNLAARAASAFWERAGLAPEGLQIEIEKQIPVCAGMAGGSSDAAAVLRGLNEHYGRPLSEQELQEAGATVGSDVPYCLLGGTALAEGRGERLTPLPRLPDCHLVICKPNVSVSTPELFGRIRCSRIRRRPDTAGMLEALEGGQLAEVARRVYNVFEDVLPERTAHMVSEVKNRLTQCGALGAVMSGTGSAVFGIFQDEACAQEAYLQLREQYADTFLTKPV